MHRVTAYLVFHSKVIRKLCEGDPILLFSGGKLIKHKLKKHSITEKDLLQAIHEQNLDDFEKVKCIWFETDGKLSIVKKEGV